MSATRTRKPESAGVNGQEGPALIVGELKRLEEKTVEVRLLGLTPLIPHKWSEKALHAMREKQYGNRARAVKPPKDPEEDARQSCYWVEAGVPGMPATAFKAAIVDATRFFEGITAVLAKQLFYVEGEGPDQLVRVEGAPQMFEATPRNSGGTVDLRYRMRIFPWEATLRVRFIAKLIDDASVLALVDAGGRGGVGDWRPSSPKSKTGTYGTWRVGQARG